MALFLQQLVNALVLGGVYALLSISLTFIYAVAGVVQLAQGDIMIVGAYAGFLATLLIPNLFVALIVGAGVTALLGVLVNDAIFARLRNAGHLSPLIAGLALGTVIEEALRVAFFSGHPVTYPARLGNPNDLGFQVLILAIALALGAGFEWLVNRTRYGRALRATAENPEAARLLGVPVLRMIRLSFMVGSAMAGAAGVLLAVVFQYITPFIGGSIEFTAIAVVLFGGLGSVPGAVVGAFVLSTSQVLATTYVSSTYRDAITFAIIVIVMLVRPTGLFGRSRDVRA